MLAHRAGDVVLSQMTATTGDLSPRIRINDNEARNYRIDFAFPFYGQMYTEIYIANSGVVSMGEPFWQPNMQTRSLNAPARSQIV